MQDIPAAIAAGTPFVTAWAPALLACLWTFAGMLAGECRGAAGADAVPPWLKAAEAVGVCGAAMAVLAAFVFNTLLLTLLAMALGAIASMAAAAAMPRGAATCIPVANAVAVTIGAVTALAAI